MDKRTIKYEGTLNLNDVEINCYVLEDGTRILSSAEMQRTLKIVDPPKDGARTWGNVKPVFNPKNAISLLT